jgi:S1-C subfamily serine protease
VTSRQLAVPMVAAILGSAITAVAITASGDESGASRQAGLLAASSEVDQRLSVKEIYDRTAPAVVHIQARGVQPTVGAPFEGGAGPAEGITTGSGFVLDEEGRLVTSARVVSGVTDLRVIFSNLRSVPARVIGKDEETDLAVLQVDPEGLDLRPLELGDSSSVQPGDQAVLVANPSGVGATAGTGTIAGAHESIETPSGVVLRDVLETDALIEPAAAGAPLLGADGRVIGISSGTSPGPDGLGLAVPADTAKSVLAELEERHKVIRPYIGLRGRTITVAQTSDDGEAAEGGGVRVLGVYPGSPSEVAGLQGAENGGGDVIKAIDGEPVDSLPDLLAEVADHQPGESVSLTVERDGALGDVVVRLTERPASLPSG